VKEFLGWFIPFGVLAASTYWMFLSVYGRNRPEGFIQKGSAAILLALVGYVALLLLMCFVALGMVAVQWLVDAFFVPLDWLINWL
jgi:hypothetical protein